MDRPILFNGDMVRAILDGRKTQTRRIVKPQPVEWRPGSWSWPAAFTTEKPYPWTLAWHEPHRPKSIGTCPYGQPGDRLWVRETWRMVDSLNRICIYKADPRDAETQAFLDAQKMWKPSIHMPRWASRLTLVIESVRVERLQDISEEDARVVGVECCAHGEYDFDYGSMSSARANFRRLWSSVYGAESWERNDWVWVVEFRKAEASR
jgi:hypothetical protein